MESKIESKSTLLTQKTMNHKLQKRNFMYYMSTFVLTQFTDFAFVKIQLLITVADSI